MIKLQNDKKIRIKEMSKLFQVPVSTLHYWEKEGLLQVQRSENEYREYSKRNLFDIWELSLYRKMQVPIEKLKKMNRMNIDKLENILSDTEEQLEAKIKEQTNNLKKLKEYRYNVAVWKRLESEKYLVEQPDLEALYEDPFDDESMKKTIMNPMDCCLYIPKGKNYQPIMCLPSKKNRENTIWKKEEHKNKKYIVIGIKTEIGNTMNNDITERIKELQQVGYKTGDIVARFLFSAWDDRRYDYHKAWIEVN